MSIWTHVNGAIRINGLFLSNAIKEELVINKMVGKMTSYNDLMGLDIDEQIPWRSYP